MFRIIGKLYNVKAVAVSGGADSIAVAHFISRVNPRLEILHVNHGTEHSSEAQQTVASFCRRYNLNMSTVTIKASKPKHLSWEEFWRLKRYDFFHQYNGEVVTAHNLDDVAETYLFGCANGRPKLIPYRNENVVRPFLLVSKMLLTDWCVRNNLNYIEDPSNQSRKYMRNIIRHDIMPQIKRVNKGFLKVISKKVMAQNGML